MKKLVLLIFIITFVVLFLMFGYSKQQKIPQPETHEVEVRLVLVDVIITKDGKFVTDLTMNDFELFEDGEKVPINSFELISFGERELIPLEKKVEEKITPAIPKKQLVVVFDGACSWQRNLKEGGRKIVNELVDLAKLGHEVMIIQLKEKTGVEIVQPFTTDEKLIRKAMLMASANIWLDKSEDALKMWQEIGAEFDEELGLIERYEERLHPVLEQEYLFIQRGRFEKAVGGLFAVANMIKDLPGRKSIVLISDGLPDLSSRTIDDKISEATGAASKARTEGLDQRRDVGTIRVFDPFNILEKKKIMSGEEIIRELIHFTNAQNISIYSLDPDAFTKYFISTTAEFGPRERMEALSFRGEEKIKRMQNLRWLSEDTGAVALRGAQKYDNFYKVMTTDLSYYYQLSYYPPRSQPDDRYHKIQVKIKRSGVDVRARKGYTDYSENEEEKMLLVSAFYNPSLFTDLPFEAEFIPFHKEKDKYEPWMNIALPAKKLFIERGAEYGTRQFNFHFWIKDKKMGERAFAGKIAIPFNINSSFMDVIKTTDYLCYHYKGQEMPFKQNEYQAIFALYDDQSNEIGVWESSFILPDFKKKQGNIINCVLGLLTPSHKNVKRSFIVSKKDGSLEYGEIKFFPSVTNQFQRMEDAFVFLQVYLPQGKISVTPNFIASGKGKIAQQLPGEIVAEEWNKKTKIWSGIFNLKLRTLLYGDYNLRVDIPVSKEGPFLSKETKLTKLRY
ncbi:MAG: VWA domain-containing protein [Candidatus Aminicenantaceae bacterium]